MPVLDEKADERYHRQHRKMKPAVEVEGRYDARDLGAANDDAAAADAKGERLKWDETPPLRLLNGTEPLPCVAPEADANVWCAVRATLESKADKVPVDSAGERGRYAAPPGVW